MSLRTFCGIRVCLVRIWHYHTYVVSYASGKRDVASVDGDSAVERELRLRVELFQSFARQKRRTEQGLSNY